jgi:hypothetical protein
LLGKVSPFGIVGSGAAQLQNPQKVAIQPTSGNVYRADTRNARVEQLDPTGHAIATLGRGVKHGKSQSEVCTKSCRAGIGHGVHRRRQQRDLELVVEPRAKQRHPVGTIARPRPCIHLSHPLYLYASLKSGSVRSRH